MEFGLCKQNGTVKAYGAGLLSSYGELVVSVFSMLAHTHTHTRFPGALTLWLVPTVCAVQWARVQAVHPWGDCSAAVSGPDLPACLLCVWEFWGCKAQAEVCPNQTLSWVSCICTRASVKPLYCLHMTRRYSATIKRPFAVRYDPFTCSVEVLDQPSKIQNALSQMREDLKTLHSALEKLSSS